MSFDIWVSAFKNEESFWFPASELRQRFSKHIESEDYGTWKLHFDEGPCLARIWVEDGKMISGFTVSRPPDYLVFWDIIGGVLRDFPCVLYWLGGHACMGSLDLLPHLPADFVKIHGIPWVTTDGAKIRQYVEKNG